jgi:hypothetical protein
LADHDSAVSFEPENTPGLESGRAKNELNGVTVGFKSPDQACGEVHAVECRPRRYSSERSLSHNPGFQIQQQDSYLKSARLCANTHIGNIESDGTLVKGKLFFDFTRAPGEDGLDGIKVGQTGVSAPGGLWVISPEGNIWARSSRRGTRITFNWSGADGKTL